MLSARTLGRLQDMLAHAQEALAFARGRTRADLDADRLFNLAVVRLLEIVGEAASQIPAEDRNRFPEIPWTEIVRFRNRVIHGYFSVNFDILWEIVTSDLPRLISQLDAILVAEE